MVPGSTSGYFQNRQNLGRVRTIMIAKVVKLNPGKDGRKPARLDVELCTNQMDGAGKRRTEHGTVLWAQARLGNRMASTP